ncbi:MAG: cysteine-rich CWC family protein [Bacteroidales bacterium]|nr:cysteine-rich CWC family protein [Bacteroidales bacterium]
MKGGCIKICPKCGKSFTCYGEGDCWCEKVRIHKKEMLIIQQTYNDCLCPECLGEYERD